MLQAALAVVLTMGAGLLLRSFVSLAGVDPGFQPPHLLTLQISVPAKYQTADQRRVLYASLASHLSGISGVTAIGGTTRLPLGSTSVSTKIAVDGRSQPASQWPEVEFRRAIFDYFNAMGIPVLQGRGFTGADGPLAPSVCVINETMARRMFAGEAAIGQRVRFGRADGPPTTIVGVIGDVRHATLDAPPSPEVYVYYLQNPPVNPFLVVRTTSDPIAIIPEVRAQLAAVDPEISSNDIRPMSAVLSASLAQRRFVLLLAAAFGVLALIMSAVGVYGVMALVVSERIPEIAVRLALGAEPGGVIRLVLRQGVIIAAAGAGAGVCVSAVLAPILGSQLYGIRPGDPLTFTAVPLLVLAVAACACLLPALRTTRIDPVRALRAD
jgi:predicted permease